MDSCLLDPTQLRILLVDDTPANIDILRKVLIEQGYNIAFAQNGEKALKLASRLLPDLILLDIMMPGIDGFETCKQLKANQDTQEIPIIFITAKTEHEDILKGFEYGGVDYIAKPFHQNEVSTRVKTHLQLQVSKRQLIRLNHEKNHILKTTAHHFKDPITSIIGTCDMLSDDFTQMENDEIRNYLDKITAVSHQMLAKLKSLADSSEIERGCFGYSFCLNQLEDIVDISILSQAIAIRKKRLSLQTHYAELPQIRLDPSRISQVITSLLTGIIIQINPNASITIELVQHNKKQIALIFQLIGQLTLVDIKQELEISQKVIAAHKGDLLTQQLSAQQSRIEIRLPLSMV